MLSNWNEYVNTFLTMINCAKYDNVELLNFIQTSWYITYYFNNFEPLVVGLNFQFAVVVMIKFFEFSDQPQSTEGDPTKSSEFDNMSQPLKKTTLVKTSIDS